MKRRDFLIMSAGALAAAEAMALLGCRGAESLAGGGIDTIPKPEPLRPLAKHAADRGILFGAAARMRNLRDDATFADAYAREAALMVPEWEMKWEALRAAPDAFDFTRPDWLAAWAAAHAMKLRGHTLVWHLALPAWVQDRLRTAPRAECLALLRAHIRTVVRHFAGVVNSWDVVNEPLDVAASSGLRDSIWRQALGDDYIRVAFETAAEADPAVRLVLNDYQLEGDAAECVARRKAMLTLLESLRSGSVPLHALGVQGHLGRWNTSNDFAQFREFLREVSAMGLEILVTELDVADDLGSGDTGVRDQYIADVYARFLAAALDEPAVSTVLTWGLSDRYTWLEGTRADGSAVRPLPLDAALHRKPAWTAMADAFDNAPARTVSASKRILQSLRAS